MLKMVFFVLLLLGLIFNMVTIELSLSFSAYGQLPYLPSNQEQQPAPSYGVNNQRTVFNNLNNNSKVVILTFGDGYKSQYVYAKPILDKYGFKANFFNLQ